MDTVRAGLSRLTTVTREQEDSGTQSLSQSITVVQARGSSLKIILKKNKTKKRVLAISTLLELCLSVFSILAQHQLKV